MKTITKSLIIGCLLVGACNLAQARTFLGEVKVNSEGKIQGTVLNQGAKDIETDTANFPTPIPPGQILEYSVDKPAVGQPLQIRYQSSSGEGCIFYMETFDWSGMGQEITYVSAQSMHAREQCGATGLTGNHISVMADRTNSPTKQ